MRLILQGNRCHDRNDTNRGFRQNAKSAAVIPQIVNSAVSPSLYTYTRQNTRRNLYRIPLP